MKILLFTNPPPSTIVINTCGADQANIASSTILVFGATSGVVDPHGR